MMINEVWLPALEDDGAKMTSFLLSSELTAVMVVQLETRQRVESKVKGRVRKISPARLSAAVSTLEGSPVPLPWSFLLIAPAFCLLRFGPLNGNICNFLHNNQISKKMSNICSHIFCIWLSARKKKFYQKLKALLAELLNRLISSLNSKNDILIGEYFKSNAVTIESYHLAKLPVKFQSQIFLPRNVVTDATKNFLAN